MTIRNITARIISIFILFIYSCANHSPDINKSIIGNWELSEMDSGVNKTKAYFKAGNSPILMFNGVGFRSLANGGLSSTGSYKIILDTFKTIHQIANRLILDRLDDSIRYFIDIKDDQLIMTIDSSGAPIKFYKRIKK